MKDGTRETGESLKRILKFDTLGGCRFVSGIGKRIEDGLGSIGIEFPREEWALQKTRIEKLEPQAVLDREVFRAKVRKGFVRATERGLTKSVEYLPPATELGRWNIRAYGKRGENAVILFSQKDDMGPVFSALNRALEDLKKEPKRKAGILKDIEGGWYDPLPETAS